jgi:lipid-binding SYLF domain-containing protein
VDTFANNKEDKRADIQEMSQDTLHRLYKAEPPAKAAVEKAYGYAIFNSTVEKTFFGVSGNGRGMAVNNKTKSETFMKMFKIHEGLGTGVKKSRYVFVFDNEKVFNDSVNSGWESGGQVSAAAKTSAEKGGAMQGAAAVSNGIWMYQLTGKGVVLNITAKSTKYLPDDDLNRRRPQQVVGRRNATIRSSGNAVRLTAASMA